MSTICRLIKPLFFLVLAEISVDVFQFLQNPTAFFKKKSPGTSFYLRRKQIHDIFGSVAKIDFQNPALFKGGYL